MVFVLLPAYNEATSLEHLMPKIISKVDHINEETRIILCDDGSEDGTKEVFLGYDERADLVLIEHWINRGLGETVRDLFEYVARHGEEGDIAIRLDCDDTHDPVNILKLIRKIEEGYDIAIVSRFQKGGGQTGISLYRAFVSYCANLFMKVVFPLKGVRDYSSGFRAYRVELIQDAIRLYSNNFIQLKGLGFTCTLEKLVKLRLLEPRMAEVPGILHYDQKKSTSKMVSSITTFGYLTMMLLYYWPWGGWRWTYKKKLKEFNS
ncbi:MAG TPA: glycosyltransferase [bacterium]|nr:glycosyltransferase [bacterium]